jgi:RNA polymerase sigma-70 factor (ECF subfamily)
MKPQAEPSGSLGTGTIDVERLFREHAAFVAAFLHRMGAAREEIDDLVQDVFMTAHRKGGFRTPGAAAPRTWLTAIALRVAANARRSQTRRREDYDLERLGTVPEPAGSPAQAAELREALFRVQRALDTLDLEHRSVLVLFELDGMDCQDIAVALEIPIGTVYSRLHVARKRFAAAHAALVEGEARVVGRHAVGGAP